MPHWLKQINPCIVLMCIILNKYEAVTIDTDTGGLITGSKINSVKLEEQQNSRTTELPNDRTTSAKWKNSKIAEQLQQNSRTTTAKWQNSYSKMADQLQQNGKKNYS